MGQADADNDMRSLLMTRVLCGRCLLPWLFHWNTSYWHLFFRVLSVFLASNSASPIVCSGLVSAGWRWKAWKKERSKIKKA